MPLKDLVLSKADLTEQQVEAIVADYIRYDIDSKGIIFHPSSVDLTVRAKTLLYLVALQGWPFLTEDPVPADATPAAIAAATGIAGGSVRPVLRQLLTDGLVTKHGDAYNVRSTALELIRREVVGSAGISGGRFPTNRKCPKTGQGQPATRAEPVAPERGESGSDRKRGSGRDIASVFDSFVVQGFFDAPRSLAEVAEEFGRRGYVVPQSSVPKYLLKAVRTSVLVRERGVVDGSNKRVWIYKRA